MSYAINEYVCDEGHVTKNIQYEDAVFCRKCFRDWQEKTFPVENVRVKRSREEEQPK